MLTSWRAASHPSPPPHRAQASCDSLIILGLGKGVRRGDSHGWGPYDSYPRLPAVGAPGEPWVASSERGCAEGRFANREAAALPCSFFTTLSRQSRLKRLQMNHHKAITLPVLGSLRAALPSLRPSQTRLGRLLLASAAPVGLPGRWAPASAQHAGCSHRDGAGRELWMWQQVLVQGLCVRGSAIPSEF